MPLSLDLGLFNMNDSVLLAIPRSGVCGHAGLGTTAQVHSAKASRYRNIETRAAKIVSIASTQRAQH